MNAFNRGIMSLLAIAWIAVLAGILFLVWDESRMINFEESYAALDFDVFANTQAEQILATIILGALMLPALTLLLFEVKPGRRSVEMTNGNSRREAELEARVDSLQRQLDSERRRTDKTVDNAMDYKDRDDAVPHRRRWRFLPGRN